MTDTENKIENKKTPLSAKQKGIRSQRIALFSGLLSLILIVACALFAFTIYKQNKASVASQQVQLTELTTQLNAQSSEQSSQLRQTIKIKTTLEAQLEKVTLQLQQANNDNKISKTDIQSLQRSFAATNIRHPNDWILAEVEYLLTLTGRKIWLEKDIKTAISLLIAADQRIVELNDASLSPLRGALLEDINALEALPKRDPDGVILALTSLERRVDKLRSTSLIMPDADENKATEVSTDINEWDDNLIKSWNVFVDSFITVNKRESKIKALLSPEQSWYLQEHLRNNLAKAEFAIYREQQDVYDIALENTLTLLNNYYDLKDNETGHFYKSIKRLSKRKVSIKYPDQLKSAPLLERVIEQRLQKSLASSTLK
ncbi:uroporphyrinogen-III C-methyltransferase [Psychromonas sp. Urea-02u-13]|uniref:uroporphyrinogen-III C-methyltransferase n=1 Tax=Psychromonas sp. Urea-02u-13 TaxID=2058326 RepID=UPI001E553BCF|nr:uroporphyrinogen-III C-methyltransferase [Psychromonas sp. Urea-02u-13]